MSDMVKYRAAIWSFLKVTALYFTMLSIDKERHQLKQKKLVNLSFLLFRHLQTIRVKFDFQNQSGQSEYIQIWFYFSNPSSSDHNLNWWRQDLRKVDFSERSNPDYPARPIALHSGLRLFLKSDVSFYPLKRVSSNISCS